MWIQTNTAFSQHCGAITGGGETVMTATSQCTQVEGRTTGMSIRIQTVMAFGVSIQKMEFHMRRNSVKVHSPGESFCWETQLGLIFTSLLNGSQRRRCL
uniref:Alternative protein AOAH n=1 Tax=Homo sapiens TaxID=9606 RepID=L8E8U0_HUMAN|nr:alternative protein AOAH [Homo sapiens]